MFGSIDGFGVLGFGYLEDVIDVGSGVLCPLDDTLYTIVGVVPGPVSLTGVVPGPIPLVGTIYEIPNQTAIVDNDWSVTATQSELLASLTIVLTRVEC